MTSTPAPSDSAAPHASSPAPALDGAVADRLIGLWKKAYLLFKPIEARVDAARAKVVEMLIAAGVHSFDSKHGAIGLQTKKTTNWEALARSVVAPAFVEQLIPQFTSESAPFVRAPTRWNGEAKR